MKILTYSDYIKMKPYYSMEDAAKLMDAHVDALWDALVKNGIYPSCTACGYAIVWKNELWKLSGILYNEKIPDCAGMCIQTKIATWLNFNEVLFI